jgi:hypothetical protein
MHRCLLNVKGCRASAITAPVPPSFTPPTGEHARERESMESVAGPMFLTLKKCYNSQNKNKLNSDCTIKFVSINSSKLDLTWIYLDKVICGPHSG